MAQFSTSRNSLLKHNRDLYEVVMVSGQSGPSIFVEAGNLNTTSDAFGRLRTASPYTTFDNSFRTGDDTRNWDTENTGSASTSHLANESTMAMDVTTASGDKCIRETSKTFLYQPGKSLLLLNTFIMNPAQTNLTQRVGYFEEQNGVFLELQDDILYWVKRSYASGELVETRIPQSQWNVDRLDGTQNDLNISGINLDITKSQIQFMDIEWLGVGSVRCGFVINGQFIITHIFHHANIESKVYMTTASLPIRYEIENTGITEAASRLRHICNSVISEGGFDPIVESRSASTSLTGLILSQTVYRPLISIRLKSASHYAVVVPTMANMYGLQSNAYGYKVLQNTTLTGGTWVSAGTESTVEYNISATALTGGRDLLQGLFMGGDKGSALQLDLRGQNHSFQLRRGINNIPHTFTIAAIATNNNDYAIGTMTWGEFN